MRHVNRDVIVDAANLMIVIAFCPTTRETRPHVCMCHVHARGIVHDDDDDVYVPINLCKQDSFEINVAVNPRSIIAR